ncbi:MAG: ubiquinone/menaquinone biosynthesis methyltransferase [Verrucomicrobia bacterium]|nr:ubiquinone/menaquinone biosynthesis methyltransferase [Verrucomicrobiota bacterium]
MPVEPPSAPQLRQQDPAFVRGVFAEIAQRYDRANSLISGGIDARWRRALTRAVVAWQPARLLDLATGSGVLAEQLGRALPETEIVSADFSLPMLRQARDVRQLPRLVLADGTRLPFRDSSFDALTVAFGLRNMSSWPTALAEMRRVLRPGGHLAVLDFSLPGGWLRAPYRLYLHWVLPKLAALATGSRASYEYLAESIEKFPSGNAMCRLLEEAGFRQATAQTLTLGVVTLYLAEVP